MILRTPARTNELKLNSRSLTTNCHSLIERRSATIQTMTTFDTDGRKRRKVKSIGSKYNESCLKSSGFRGSPIPRSSIIEMPALSRVSAMIWIRATVGGTLLNKTETDDQVHSLSNPAGVEIGMVTVTDSRWTHEARSFIVSQS